MSDVYDYTDKLKQELIKEGRIVEVSKEFGEINDNAAKTKFLEKLLLERKLMPNREENMRVKKCNKTAIQYRDLGNMHYTKRDFYNALHCYNKSLCFAEENSENVGLAFGNRSAVYYEMKMYARALTNIQRALKNNYPQKNTDKLMKREKACKEMLLEKKGTKEISNDPIGKEYLQLSHEANAKIPFIADCLKLKSDEIFGRYIVTNKNLSPGDVIAIEEPFSKCILPSNKYLYCCNCLSNNFFDLLQCPNCTAAMFCSEKCYDTGLSKFHQYECSIIDRLNELCTKIMRIASQTFFEALYIYDFQMEKFMTSVEEFPIEINVFDFDHCKDNRIDKLMAINSLVSNESHRSISDYFQRCGIVAIMTHLFLNYTKLKDLVANDNERDFYIRFIVKQTQIAALNYHGIFDGVFGSKNALENGPSQYGSGSFPFCSLINHSCAPNLVRVSYDCRNYLMVNRPIRTGQQLYDNYGYHHCLEELTQRQKALTDQYMFQCACEACKDNFPLYPDLLNATNNFDQFIGDDISKLSNLDFKTATNRFKIYCDKIKQIGYYPCREVCSLQECLLQCYFIFKMTPFKLRLLNL